MSLSLTVSQAFVDLDINGDGVANNTLNDYLASFSDFTRSTWESLPGQEFNGSSFFDPYSGTEFGSASTSDDNVFIASASDGEELSYTFFSLSQPDHTLYGELDAIELGSGDVDKSSDDWD